MVSPPPPATPATPPATPAPTNKTVRPTDDAADKIVPVARLHAGDERIVDTGSGDWSDLSPSPHLPQEANHGEIIQNTDQVQ